MAGHDPNLVKGGGGGGGGEGRPTRNVITTFKIFPSPPGPQTEYMSSLCTRFISPCFSNLVSAVPERSNQSACVSTSQPEGGRTVSLQSLCHYHSAMLTTYLTKEILLCWTINLMIIRGSAVNLALFITTSYWKPHNWILTS